MANPSRLLILCQLAESEKSVGELQPLIGLSQSALSQHLAVLREKRLVRTRREGQQIFYSIASREAGALMHTLHEEFCAPQAAQALRPRRPCPSSCSAWATR